MNVYGLVVLVTVLLALFLQLVAGLLNLRSLRPQPPAELAAVCDGETYRRSQEYVRTRGRFSLVTAVWDTLLFLLFWLVGGFGWLDRLVRSLELPTVATGLLYIGALVLLKAGADLPFSVYSTFVIEERFGFNRTTIRTFVEDLAKSLGLAILLGGPLLALVLALFDEVGPQAWVYVWIAVALFTLVLQYVVPTLILPLFFRFRPLEAGELRSALVGYAERIGFPLSGIFVVDGSRRSAKANAFFTGFGRRKRIALFDTLIDKHPTDELVAVLAHEVGHYRRRHVLARTAASILHNGLLLFLLSIFLTHRGLYEAFRVDQMSVYVGLVLFGLLYAPVELVLGVMLNALSRRQEHEADRFAVETTAEASALAAALRRLAVENLTNLTPHPFYVFLTYSHPPIVERLRAVEGGVAPAGGG